MLALTLLVCLQIFRCQADCVKESEFQLLQVKVDKLEKEILKNESQAKMTKQEMLEYYEKCPVKYGDHCFFGIFVGRGRTNLAAAHLLCQSRGAEVANIYSSSHYNMLLNYLRPWIAAITDGRTSYDIRTGMTVNTQTKIAYLSDGTPAPYFSWKNGYPVTNKGYTTINLSVHPVGSSSTGLFNQIPSSAHFGAICQTKI